MEERMEQTRIRINYTVSARGAFQPDITSEAETVQTAIDNLNLATDMLQAFAVERGYVSMEVQG